jgi:hypothetical protein
MEAPDSKGSKLKAQEAHRSKRASKFEIEVIPEL